MTALSRLRGRLTPFHFALLILWAVLLFGGFILGNPAGDEQRRMPLWTRMGASITLTVAAWGWLARARTAPPATRRMLLGLAAGMSLSTLGDFFMARLILPGQDAVLGGMASFGLAHVAYSLGILHYGAAHRLTLHRLPALVGWWLFGLVSWLGIVWLPAASRSVMQAAALPYALLLATTTGAATGLALNQRRFRGLAAGAALFLFSDLILAGSLFSNWAFAGISDLIWLLYSPGQMLIVYAAAVLYGDGE